MATKNVTLYKYIPLEHAATIIRDGHIRMSDGKNFNDPFELLLVDKKEQNSRLIEGVRILCLTNSFRNKLMWSHYADEHRGICLAVSIPNELTFPICYTKTRLRTSTNILALLSGNKKGGKRNIYKSFDNLSYEQKAALIKGKNWAYEKEYRITCTTGQGDYLAEDGQFYFPVKVVRVYLGCRFDRNPQEKKEELFCECKKKNIEIKQIGLSNTAYALSVYNLESGKVGGKKGEAKRVKESEAVAPL